MNRPLNLLLKGLAPILSATVLLAAPAQATQASTAAGADAAQAARCIAQHLPRGAQMFQAADGTFRVVAFGPRGQAVRWTIRQAADNLQVTRSGGEAGVDRGLKGVCY